MKQIEMISEMRTDIKWIKERIEPIDSLRARINYAYGGLAVLTVLVGWLVKIVF